MITYEWQRILKGEEKFKDPEAEELAAKILSLIEKETFTLKIFVMVNVLEELMGSVEWLTWKADRLKAAAKEGLKEEIERLHLQEKQKRVLARRDEVMKELKARYG